MPITAFYAALLALVFVVLSFRTILYRRSHKVALGDGGDKELQRRIRVHANFAEYVPIALVLMGLAESLKLAAPMQHGIGVVLLVGRIVHAYALSQDPHILQLRVFGMVSTIGAIVAAALACLTISGRHLLAIGAGMPG